MRQTTGAVVRVKCRPNTKVLLVFNDSTCWYSVKIVLKKIQTWPPTNIVMFEIRSRRIDRLCVDAYRSELDLLNKHHKTGGLVFEKKIKKVCFPAQLLVPT